MDTHAFCPDRGQSSPARRNIGLRTAAAACMWLIAVVAVAAATEVNSVSQGAWSDPLIWDTGLVPRDGDAIYVHHGVHVPDGITLQGSTLVLSGDSSLLVFLGDCHVRPAITSLGQALIFVAPDANVVLDAIANTQIQLAESSTLNVQGKLSVGAPALGVHSKLMINTGPASTLIVQGPGPLGPSRVVSSVPLTGANEAGEDLTVLLDAPAEPEATHVKVLTGRFRNAIWPVFVAGNRVVLQGALVRPMDSSSPIAGNSSGADSVCVRDDTVGVDPVKSPGSFVLIGSGENIGIVEKVFPESGPGLTALFLDRAQEEPIGVAEPFLLSRGIARGTKLQFLRLARVQGAPERPVVDTSVGGDPSIGDDLRRGIRTSGDVRASYASFRWLGGGVAAIHLQQPDGSGARAIFDHTLFAEIHAENVLNLAFPSGPGNGECRVTNSVFFRALGPTDGNFGHWIRVAADDGDAVLYIADCAAIELKDDLVASMSGSVVTIRRTWMQDVGAGNFFDVGASGATAIIEHCQGWGIGQTPIQLDEGQIVVTLANNRWAGCGNQLGRNTVDSQQIGDANNLGWLALGGEARFTADQDTVRWAPWRAAILSCVANDTIRISNVVFENCGNYTEPGAQSWNAASVNAGPIVLTSTASAANLVVIEGCEFRNSWRRGQDLTALGWASHFGVRMRGSGTSLRAWVRGCYFNDQVSYQEGVRTGAGNACILGRDPDWIDGHIENNHFDGVRMAFYVSAPLRAVSIHHNFIGAPADGSVGPVGRLESPGSPAFFGFNTVVAHSPAYPAIQVSRPGTIKGNLFLSPDLDAKLLRLDAEAVGPGSDIQYNVFATGAPSPIQVAGYGESTVEELDAVLPVLSNNEQVGPGTAAHLFVVLDLEEALLTPDGVAIDYVQGFTDPDGTLADAGYRYSPISGTTGVGDARLLKSSIQVTPNPFNPAGVIELTLGAPARGSLEIVDVRGRRVISLKSGNFNVGVSTVVWGGRDSRGHQVASGVYYAVLRSEGRTVARSKLLILR